METSETSLIMQELAQRLSGDAGEESAQLFRALLCELVASSPVSRERLSELMGWPVNKVSAALEQAPCVEYGSARRRMRSKWTAACTPGVLSTP